MSWAVTVSIDEGARRAKAVVKALPAAAPASSRSDNVDPHARDEPLDGRAPAAARGVRRSATGAHNDAQRLVANNAQRTGDEGAGARAAACPPGTPQQHLHIKLSPASNGGAVEVVELADGAER